MPFWWKKSVLVLRENHPYCFLMAGWNGFTCPRAAASWATHAFANASGRGTAIKCSQEHSGTRKWAVTTTPACSAWSGTAGAICVPSEEMLQSNRCFPVELIFFLIYAGIYWIRNIRIFFSTHSHWLYVLPLLLHMANLSPWLHHPLNLKYGSVLISQFILLITLN